jgi:hypothetical protein
VLEPNLVQMHKRIAVDKYLEWHGSLDCMQMGWRQNHNRGNGIEAVLVCIIKRI